MTYLQDQYLIHTVLLIAKSTKLTENKLNYQLKQNFNLHLLKTVQVKRCSTLDHVGLLILFDIKHKHKTWHSNLGINLVEM